MRFSLLLPLMLVSGVLTAQESFLKEERALNRIAAKKLAGYGRIATRNKMYARAVEAYEVILRDYDPKNKDALRGLGFKKVRGEWREPNKRPHSWRDASDGPGTLAVDREWDQVSTLLAKMHRTLGLKWYAGEAVRGGYHLERAISYRHDDVESHRALGHGKLDDFWGTDSERAFVQRMRSLQAKAIELSQQSYEVYTIESLPEQLVLMAEAEPGLEFHGAGNGTFTFFIRGSQQEADECVRWAERAVDFLQYCLPIGFPPREEIRRIQKRRWAWQAFLTSRAELRKFLSHNPELGDRDLFGKIRWSNRGQASQVTVAMSSSERREDIIGGIWRSLFSGSSDPFLEGVAHAATYYLGATASTRSSDPGLTTTTGLGVAPSDSGAWWQREIREQARFGADYPLLMLPDIKIGKMRSDARLKAWSFMVWTMARLPRRWHEFLERVPKGIFTKREDFPKLVKAHFRRPLLEIEQEWRAWAAGHSATAQATGHGSMVTLCPIASQESSAIDQLNRLRAIAGLDACAIDTELSLACRNHAEYLEQPATRSTWPQRKTESPDSPGFSYSGLRAAQNSVITISDAATSEAPIDRWFGSIYHRLPLLVPYVRRVGIAVQEGTAVLDSVSLQDPRSGDRERRYRTVAWPPEGVAGVPTGFHLANQSSPLSALGGDLSQAGYPVSLLISKTLARELESASISIHECRAGVRECGLAPALAAWIHLPSRPLLPDIEDCCAIFAIPKRPLKPMARYLCRVTLRIGRESEEIRWHFTTGRRAQGHADLHR